MSTTIKPQNFITYLRDMLPSAIFITYEESSAETESGHSDLKRKVYTGESGRADLLRVVAKETTVDQGYADLARKVQAYEAAYTDLSRRVAGPESGHVDTNRVITDLDKGHTDIRRNVNAIIAGHIDLKRAIIGASTGHADLSRTVINTGIPELGRVDILRKVLNAETGYADLDRRVMRPGVTAKPQLYLTYAPVNVTALPELYVCYTPPVIETGHTDLSRYIPGTIEETGRSDMLREVYRAIFFEYGSTDLKRIVIGGGEFGRIDLQRSVTNLTETGRTDLSRRIPFYIDDTGSTYQYQSLTINLQDKILADAFTLLTPKTDIKCSDLLQGKILDFEYIYKTESIGYSGIMRTVTGRYNLDDLRYTAISVDSLDFDDGIPIGNTLLGLPVKKYYRKFTLSTKFSGYTTYADLINQVYGWTSRIEVAQINVFIRNDAVYLVQRGYEPNTIDLTDSLRGFLPKIQQSEVRKIWNYTQESQTYSTGAQSLTVNAAPFSGTISFEDWSTTFANGLATSTIKGAESTTYGYTSFDGDAVYPSSASTVDNSDEKNPKTTNTTYGYSNIGSEVFLAGQHDVITDNSGTHTRDTAYFPLSAGFWGFRNYVDGVEKSHGISPSKPGNKVSKFSIEKGFTIPGSSGSYTRNWYTIGANGFPLSESDDFDYVNDLYERMDGGTHEQVSFELYNYNHVVDFTDKIMYQGHTYHLISNTISRTPKELKQSIVMDRYMDRKGVEI